ncbi:MAG: YbjN domain-containing protein [Planctomycetes bacterium]|nr:YbjN domain-containing protein [Planctomycetota bacterium]
MRLHRVVVSAFTAVLVWPLFVAGDEPVKKEVIETMTAPRLERLMKSLKVKLKEVEGKTDSYTFEFEKRTVVLINSSHTLEAVCFFKDEVTSSRINEWNRKWRYTKVYVAEDKSLVLSSDYCLSGGVTEEAVAEWMRRFAACFKEFDKHFGD